MFHYIFERSVIINMQILSLSDIRLTNSNVNGHEKVDIFNKTILNVHSDNPRDSMAIDYRQFFTGRHR